MVDTFVNTSSDLTTLEVRNGEYAWTITGTPEHPFYIPSMNAWVEMGQLAGGDILSSPEGAIEVVSASTAPVSQAVYNFEVQDAHTYFVGSADVEGGSVLVHNSCNPNRAAEMVRRGQGPRGITRIDRPNLNSNPHAQWEAHIGEVNATGQPALQFDGTWKHGGATPPRLTRQQKAFLRRFGWTIPED